MLVVQQFEWKTLQSEKIKVKWALGRLDFGTFQFFFYFHFFILNKNSWHSWIDTKKLVFLLYTYNRVSKKLYGLYFPVLICILRPLITKQSFSGHRFSNIQKSDSTRNKDLSAVKLRFSKFFFVLYHMNKTLTNWRWNWIFFFSDTSCA